MRTIQKILKKAGYTTKQLEKLKKLNVINGCGGEGGFDFTGFAKHTITFFQKFNTEKHKKFIDDLNQICYLHDIDYTLGNNFLQKLKADFYLAKRVYQILSWTNKKNRILASLGIFLGVTFWGCKFYKNPIKYTKRKFIIKIKYENNGV